MAILDDRETWEATFQEEFIAHWQATGKMNWRAYPRPKNDPLPRSAGIELANARVLLVSTAGGYLADTQEPFDAPNPLGDYSIRTFPIDTPFDALAYAHEHYDHTAVDADPQVLLPLPELAARHERGDIGALAPSVVSFMGYQPDLIRVVDEMIPSIVRVAKEFDVQAALLVPA